MLYPAAWACRDPVLCDGKVEQRAVISTSRACEIQGMSFQLPDRQMQSRPRRSMVTAHQVQRDADEDAQQHRNLCNELRLLSQKQAQRIEKLKVDTAVQLEHQATLRRLELEQRKSRAMQQISDLTPRLEVVRGQWNHAKSQNQGHEMEWGNLRTQYQHTKLRVDALRDQITDGRSRSDNIHKTLGEMREHLHKLDRDKAALRAKMQRAIECLLIDEKYLATRIAEEELYRQQVEKALANMEEDYQESQSQHKHELAPLQEDVRLLTDYLTEMQNRTQRLREKCIEMEGKAATVEDHWLESVRAVYEGFERANHLDHLKTVVLTALEQQMLQCDEKHARPKAGNMDAFWLSNAVLVWELVVREVTNERQKQQVRDDSSQQLAEITQRCQNTKAMFDRIKAKVEDEGPQRRTLLQDITELHFLIDEKKNDEEEMMRFLQEVATQLEEDLSRVLHLVRKDTYDDYVSSTEHEEDVEDFDSQKMRLETHDDISKLVSSLDLDPNDPGATEQIRQMSHRPEGPLRDFTVTRRRALEQKAGPAARLPISERQRRGVPQTLERALMDTQVKVVDEVVNFVRTRSQGILQGRIDPNKESLQADPKHVSRAKELNARVERWAQTQRQDPSRAINFSKSGDSSVRVDDRSGFSGPTNRIVIEGARLPPEIQRANAIAKAHYFATNAIRGYNFLVYVYRSSVPELRQVFLSRDFSRIISRRVTQNEEEEDLTSLRVGDISDILLGHKTEVFKTVRNATRHIIKEETAFSMVTNMTSLDIECETFEYRQHWAAIFAWVVNELRPSGILTTLVKSNKINVVNTLNRGSKDEIRDRSTLQVVISNA
jgi:hypothetical protein